jgi:hypothetical protein
MGEAKGWLESGDGTADSGPDGLRSRRKGFGETGENENEKANEEEEDDRSLTESIPGEGQLGVDQRRPTLPRGPGYSPPLDQIMKIGSKIVARLERSIRPFIR